MGTRKILPWIAAASGLLVALHPNTSWLVQFPVRGIAVALTGGVEKNRQRVAEQNPQNVTLALAAAGDDLGRIQGLINRFPNSPEVCAAALRLATQEGKGVRLLPPDKEGKAKPQRVNTDAVQTLIANAEAGARLDPENAFFPSMKAVGMLALHQDDDAWAALHEAAKKHYYNDYVAASMRGKLQLLEQTQGRTPTIPAVALVAAELFPHYAPLRAAALWAQEKAITEEKAGRIENGMTLRRNLLTLGTLIRRDASTLIGTSIGEAFCAIGTGKPNGVKVPELKEFLKTGESEESAKERRMAQVAQVWRDWALKIGQPELAEVAAQNHERFVQARAHRQRTENRSLMSVQTLVSEGILLLLAAWLFGSFMMTALGALGKNTSAVALPAHPIRIVAPAMGIEALGVTLVLLASSKSSMNLAWVGVGLLILGMLLPDMQTTLIARRMGLSYKELAPVVRRSVYPVLACLILILWSALMFGLAQQENRWRARLDATITHEYTERMRDV